MLHGVIIAFTHAVIVLTASFFVLFAVQKIEAQWLKIFGYVLAVLLWLAAALTFAGGATGFNNSRACMMGGHGMMKGKMMDQRGMFRHHAGFRMQDEGARLGMPDADGEDTPDPAEQPVGNK